MGWEGSLILCLWKPFNLIETIKTFKNYWKFIIFAHAQPIPVPSFYVLSFWRDDITFSTFIINSIMGNQNNPNSSNNAQGASSQKIVLRLRSRDIILHYGFKMKATISDLDIFPHQLQGLKLWDIDIILARYVILEADRFKAKDVLVVKAGVGIAAVALGKWTQAKSIAICDVREEVVRNGAKNCLNNGVNSVISFRLSPQQIQKATVKYDHLVCPDLLADGFSPQQILQIFTCLLRQEGEAVMVMPQKKEQARKLLQVVDKRLFKITNLILTAEQYETSPLFNRLQAEKEFPMIGKANYYAIIFKRLPQEKKQQ